MLCSYGNGTCPDDARWVVVFLFHPQMIKCCQRKSIHRLICWQCLARAMQLGHVMVLTVDFFSCLRLTDEKEQGAAPCFMSCGRIITKETRSKATSKFASKRKTKKKYIATQLARGLPALAKDGPVPLPPAVLHASQHLIYRQRQACARGPLCRLPARCAPGPHAPPH